MKDDNHKNAKEISKTWISGQNSTTLVIPKTIAKKHGLDIPSYVLLESKGEGILIKKFDFR